MIRTERAEPPVDPDRAVRLGRLLGQLGWPLLLLTLIEFLAGMALNLYTTLPSTGGAVELLSASPWLLGHVVVAILILGVLARILLTAARLGDRTAITVALLGIGSGILSSLGGIAFTFGDQSASASYGMSVGFVGVLLTAGMLLARWGVRPGSQRTRVPTVGSVEDRASS